MADWSSVKQQILDSLNRVQDTKVVPGDESSYSNSNVPNYVIDKMGLPQNWKTTIAEDKKFYGGLPEQMGLATMGSIKLLKPDAKLIAAKLEQAMAQGYKPTAAESLALSKFNGSNVAVVPSHADAALEAPLKPVKALFNDAPKNLTALQTSPNGPIRPLKLGTGSGL